MTGTQYEDFVRARITQLRLERDISEHRMSLELGKSGSYIRSITSGATLPSLRELFNIIAYFDIMPVKFFAPMEAAEPRQKLCARIQELSDSDLEKVATFLDWIEE